MHTLSHINVSEFQSLLRSVAIPSDTKVTVTFEDEPVALAVLRQQKGLEALRKLRGSGNGRLMAALMRERVKERKRDRR